MSDEPEQKSAEEVEGDPGNPDEALARLAQMKDAEPESSSPTPYWLGGLVLIGVIGFLTLFPMLLDGGAADEQRLKEALSYCKYRQDQAPCEERIRARYETCVERHEDANRPGVDVYGQCMMQEFPDFYLTAGWNQR